MPSTVTERPPISEGYLSKAEASAKFDRHEATLTTDILTAIDHKDEEILSLLKLQTKDGVELPGTKVTVAKVKQLRKEGMQPWWYLHPTDVVPLFIKRKSRGVSPSKKKTIRSTNQSKQEGTSPHLDPIDTTQVQKNNAVEVAVLRDRAELLNNIITDLKADKAQLRSDTKELKGVIKRQATALQQNAGVMLVDKQTIRDLQLQLEERNDQPPRPTPNNPGPIEGKVLTVPPKSADEKNPSNPKSPEPDTSTMSLNPDDWWPLFQQRHLPTVAPFVSKLISKLPFVK